MQVGKREQSGIVFLIGLLVAAIAIVGTQVLGWEWGSDQLAPTLIGIGVAGIAILVFVRRYIG